MSTSLSAGLSQAAKLPEPALAAIARHAPLSLLQRADDASFLESKEVAAVEQGALKQAYSALASLFVEAARVDADAATLGALLEECRLSGGKAEAIVQSFVAHKSHLRLALRSSSEDVPHLVDVAWRLDFHLKSNSLEKVHEPSFLLELKVDNGPRRESVQLACSTAQLQDLVAKLKDAAKSMEHAAAI